MDGESKKVQADMRSRSPSEEPADLPSGIPDNINVVCGDARGVLDLKTARVLYQGTLQCTGLCVRKRLVGMGSKISSSSCVIGAGLAHSVYLRYLVGSVMN